MVYHTILDPLPLGSNGPVLVLPALLRAGLTPILTNAGASEYKCLYLKGTLQGQPLPASSVALLITQCFLIHYTL